ncbi:hypothetical protein LSH36_27g01056 [Paralvinella palmiformis]|uniref:SAM domain-containing protein n=1 Tax=Paralvinella palmiformis TaxID=53620 RepID=A0AAD9KAC4_9ANNE|nr:hypothetical protein LSH36_27g01056 [Paralvinella palmiformis]
MNSACEKKDPIQSVETYATEKVLPGGISVLAASSAVVLGNGICGLPRPFYTRRWLMGFVPVDQWTVTQVIEWMAVIQLYRYAEVFKHYSIKGRDLKSLNYQKLLDMKINNNKHRTAILVAIDELCGREPSSILLSSVVSNIRSVTDHPPIDCFRLSWKGRTHAADVSVTCADLARCSSLPTVVEEERHDLWNCIRG